MLYLVLIHRKMIKQSEREPNGNKIQRSSDAERVVPEKAVLVDGLHDRGSEYGHPMFIISTHNCRKFQ